MRAWPGARVAAAATLIIGGALVVLLAAAWVAGLTVGRSELERADLRLASEARSAAAAFAVEVARADARAGSVASSPALERAVRTSDLPAIRSLVAGRSGIAVLIGGKLVAGALAPSAVRRTVIVEARGGHVARVVGSVPINAELRGRLARRVGVRSPDRLLLIHAQHATGRSTGRIIEGRRYRLVAVSLPGTADVAIAAATPRAGISDRTNRRTLWLVLATIVSVATAALAVVGVLRTRPRARRRSPGRAVRQAHALVGDALASTHNPERLLPVILHAALQATGAAAGVVVRDGREIAHEGRLDDVPRSPLSLELVDASRGEEEISLVLYPAEGAFDEQTTILAHSLAAQAAVALENARLHGIVKRQAVTDELTGLANRRSFLDALETELRRAERFESALAVVFADLDDFKRVNDVHGHQAGDDVLRAFGEGLSARIRGIDVAARLGGEEFALLLPETDAAGATALAENLRAAIARLAVPSGASEIRITASFGVAAFPETHNADELMTSADRALYAAKREGKNRVVAFGGE